jgi:hypothetical protein
MVSAAWRDVRWTTSDGRPAQPMLAHAAELPATGSLPERLGAWLRSDLAIDVDQEQLQALLADGRLIPLLDGLDEIPPEQAADLCRELRRSMASAAVAASVVACAERQRSRLLTDATEVVQCDPLTAGEVARLSAEVVRPEDEREAVSRRIDDVMAATDGNALLVSLALDALRRTGVVASHPLGLLEGHVTRALAELGSRTADPTQVLWAEASNLGLRVVRQGRRTVGREEVGPALLSCLDAAGGLPGFVEELGPGRIGFTHRLVAEFCAGTALRDASRELAELAHSHGAADAVAFAILRSSDPVGRAVDVAGAVGLDELEQLGPRLAVLGAQTLNEIYSRIRFRLHTAVVGGRSGKAMSGTRSVLSAVHGEEDESDDLLSRWNQIEASEASGKQRGDELEELMDTYFSQVFRVVGRKRMTTAGEFDLVLTIREGSAPSWSPYLPDIGVECKNHRAANPVEQVNAFESKLRNSGFRLGFFVTSNRATSFARQRALSGGRAPEEPLVVILDGNAIRRSLTEPEGPSSDFLEDLVRRTRMRHL